MAVGVASALYLGAASAGHQLVTSLPPRRAGAPSGWPHWTPASCLPSGQVRMSSAGAISRLVALVLALAGTSALNRRREPGTLAAPRRRRGSSHPASHSQTVLLESAALH